MTKELMKNEKLYQLADGFDSKYDDFVRAHRVGSDNNLELIFPYEAEIFEFTEGVFLVDLVMRDETSSYRRRLVNRRNKNGKPTSKIFKTLDSAVEFLKKNSIFICMVFLKN